MHPYTPTVTDVVTAQRRSDFMRVTACCKAKELFVRKCKLVRVQMNSSSVCMLKCISLPFQDKKKTGDKMASDSPRRPSRCAGGVLVRAQAAT